MSSMLLTFDQWATWISIGYSGDKKSIWRHYCKCSLFDKVR